MITEPATATESIAPRVQVVAATVVFFEALFYAVLPPLIPHYRHELGLSDASVGVFVSAYFAGCLVGAAIGGRVVDRIGPKRSTVVSLVALAATTAPFGFLHSAAALIADRGAQGALGVLCWTCAMAWLAESTPERRRGSILGTTLGIAFLGAGVGPLVGAGALATDIGAGFAVVAVAELAVAGWISRTPAAASGPREPTISLGRGLRSGPVRNACWLLALATAMQGVLLVLIPLRASALGAGSGTIAAIFGAAALPEAIGARIVGRWSDRTGLMTPMRVAAMSLAGMAVVLLLASSVPVLAAAVIVAWFVFSALTIPVVVLVLDAGLNAGLDAARVWTLVNFVWPGGLLAGSLAAGLLAQGLGLTLSFLSIAVAAVALRVALAPRGQREPAHEGRA